MLSVLAIALLASSSVTPDKGDGYTASLDVCNSSDPHQQWTLRDAWGANNTLINVALGTDTKCLDIQGWKVDNEGNPAQSWHCCCEDKQSLCPGHCGYPDKNYNEQWTFEAATGHLRVFGSDRKPGLCLEAKAAQAGAELQLWECTSAHTTVNTWTVNEAKDGPLLRLVAHDDDGDNFCLTTKPGSPPPSPGPPPAPATPPCANASLSEFPWCNASLSFEARAALLAGALTPAELVEQISTFSFTSNHSGTVPGVERVRLPPYNYHSEGLHGVRDSCDGPATVWPQVVGMAATGNLTLVHEMGKYMGLGFRAARNALGGGKLPAKGCGLSVYGPTMNLIRDARWGRNQETVSEDPALNGYYADAIVRGVQGNDARYLQVAYTCKHLVAYSVEANRMHGSNAVVSRRDLSETYMPAFKACVRAGSQQLMCSYNAVTTTDDNVTKGACFRDDVQNDMLRGQWGFNGSIVSDCDAVKDQAYRYPSNEACAAAGVQAGCDQDCGGFYGQFGLQAYEKGLLTRAQLTTATARTLLMRFRLGEFDDPDGVPFSRVPTGSSNSSASAQSSLRAARESIVLLNNSANALPLRSTLTPTATGAGTASPLRLALLGPMADATSALVGAKSDYSPSHIISFEEGLKARGAELTVTMSKGCDDVQCASVKGFDAAVAAAKAADVTVIVVGIDHTIESEGHDRSSPSLPGNQVKLVQQTVSAVGAAKVVIVLANGGPVSVDWVKSNCPTVLEVFLGGQWAGAALADVLLGRYSPSGMLPYSVYPESYVQGNAMDDFEMRANPAKNSTGRTYRFHEPGSALWPFGFGGSYSTFAMSWDEAAAAPSSVTTAALAPSGSGKPGMSLTLKVTNTGQAPAAKVVLAFAAKTDSDDAPRKELIAVRKVHLEPGASATLSLDSDGGADLGFCAFCTVAADGKSRSVSAGKYRLSIGDGDNDTLTHDFVATGSTVTLPL